jgi:teichuronic acid exporter
MDLKQKVISALGWSIGIKLATQIVAWTMTLVVVRMLSPDDYGLIAESQVFVNVLLFAYMGLGDALIQQKEMPQEVVSRAFGVLLLSSTGLTVLAALGAHPIADWYHEPRLIPLIQIYSFGFLFSGIITLPQAHLTKRLLVKPLLIIDFSSTLIGGLVTVFMVLEGYGVWALMVGWLVSGILKVVLFITLCSGAYVFPRFGFSGLYPLVRFGIFRMLEIMAWITYTSADIIVISHWLGPTATGVYAVAMNFVTLPVNRFLPIINSIAFPAFAQIQEQRVDAHFYAVKALRLLATVSVPIFFGLCATAPEAVAVLLGPKWIIATPTFGVLALATTFRAILFMFPNYLLGIGDARASFWCAVTGVFVFPPAFVIGCQWGIEGVAYSWLIGYPAVFVINSFIASRRGGLDFSAVIAAPVGPMIAGAIMIAAVAAARVALPGGLPPVGSLGILIAVGAMTYCIVLAGLFRRAATEMVRVVYR